MEESSKGQGRKQGFERKLAIYAVAGGAVLAWPGTVPAEIIYSGLLNKTLPEISANLSVVQSYDLQIGGTKQFTVRGEMNSGSSSTPTAMAITPYGQNVPLSSADGGQIMGVAMPFGAGSSIGPNAYWVGSLGKSQQGAIAMGPGYYGLLFDLSDGYHYGWVQAADFRNIEFFLPPEMIQPGYPDKVTYGAFTLVDWAYQNEPDVAIGAGEGRAAVPEPSTLSLLAMGALGLAAWRSRKQDGKNS
jgi:hypothetical protein